MYWLLAPHGRGYGGKEAEYRTLLGEVIQSTVPSVEKLRAAILGITPPSDYAICSIPDMIARQKPLKTLLLWHCVAQFKTTSGMEKCSGEPRFSRK